MTYELCKKLKDAGFPQELPGTSYLTPDGPAMLAPWLSGDSEEKQKELLKESDWASVPTLSELIEACGLQYGNLQPLTVCIEPKKIVSWLATSFVSNRIDTPIGGNGETPEEAVANLWLKLNEK
jgi:hypothetical protein